MKFLASARNASLSLWYTLASHFGNAVATHKSHSLGFLAIQS